MGQKDIIGCFIPECFNTSEDPPGKRFARVPCLPKLRQLWIKAGLRLKVKVPLVDKSPMYCCEDHFNLHNDATNQWLCSNDQYERGNFIKLKRGILPHIFPSKSKEYVKSSRKKIIRRRSSTNEHENLKHELEQKLDLIDLTDSHESTSIKVDTTINITEDELEDTKTSRHSNQNVSVNPKEHDCGKEQEKLAIDNINRIEIIPDIEKKKDITKNVSPLKHRRSSDRSQSDKDTLKEESENPKEKHQEEENTVLSKEHKIEEDKEVLTTDNKDNAATKEEIENVVTGNSPIQNFEKNLLRGKRKIKKRPRKMSFSQQLPDGEEECLFKGQPIEEQSETDETRSKKKRTVVKEILAWIPSNTSNLPMTSPMQQPFIMLPTSTFPGLGVPNLHSIPNPIPAEDTQYVVSSTGMNSPQVQNEENRAVNFKEVTTEIRSLKETMESLNKEMTLLRSDNVMLKEQNVQIIEHRKREEVKHDESKRLEIAAESLRQWFTPNQVTLLLDKPEDKCKINWNDSEMDNAAKLYNISPQAYKYVLESMKYPFPSIQSVRKYAEKKGSPEKDPHWRECTNYELFNEMEDSDEALVESMLEQYNTKEKLEDEGAVRHNKWKPTTSMAEQDMRTTEVQETLIKASKTDVKLGTSNQPLKIPGRRYEESPLAQDEMEIPPKIIRVPVQHSKGKNKGTSSSKINLNEILTANNHPQKVPPTFKPKIVKVGPPVNMIKTPSEFRSIKTKLKEVVRARKEIKGSLIDVSQTLKQNTTSIERETVLKNTSKNGARCYSVTLMDNSIEKQAEKKDYLADEVLNYNHESIAEEFIVNHDYHENTDKHISQVIMHEGVDIGNVPEIISTEDGSKVIRLQVNSMPGEDPTLYEEVVIHCDDPTIFDNEVVSLSFSHDDPMVDTAFL